MINPDLFSKLEAYFGKGNVRVSNKDISMACGYNDYTSVYKGNKSTRKQLLVEDSGEEYVVSCPFCSDTRYRLTVNHRWGLKDPTSDSLNLWLLHCYNEDCQSIKENRDDLFRMVYGGYVGAGSLPLQRVTKGKTQTRKMTYPGAMWLLDDMKARSPNHAAIEYLEARLMDPVYLAKRFGVAFCSDSSGVAHNRIVAPVFYEGKLVGWQARSLGEPRGGTPKWYTSPGMKRGQVIYNFDTAKNYKTKVIVEGPPDVWGFGPQAMGIFGKSMANKQRKLLRSCTKDGDVIVIMLDPDQHADERHKTHHIEKLKEQLESSSTFAGRVVTVYLPSGSDPGELERGYMRQLTKEAAARQGLELPAGRHAKSERVVSLGTPAPMQLRRTN